MTYYTTEKQYNGMQKRKTKIRGVHADQKNNKDTAYSNQSTS